MVERLRKVKEPGGAAHQKRIDTFFKAPAPVSALSVQEVDDEIGEEPCKKARPVEIADDSQEPAQKKLRSQEQITVEDSQAPTQDDSQAPTVQDSP
ncbi:unnamed protein product, partial [Symbiodinium pilosum]